MKPTRIFTQEKDGFYGAWYPAETKTEKGMIVMLGDSSDDLMASSGAKWMKGMGFLLMVL